MLSQKRIKLIHSLAYKKYRDDLNLFVAEGTKLVLDLCVAFEPEFIVATSDWLKEHKNRIQNKEVVEVNEDDIKKISSQKSPQGVLCVFRRPHSDISSVDFHNSLCLALDGVQDPGNLGTIIRIADWFGIRTILCSHQCADAFGNKTVQATMGALARVNLYYVDLAGFLGNINQVPVYGTFMDGDDIYQTALAPTGIIVMGNEGNGISPGIEKYVSRRLLVPNYPPGQPTSESLNVGVATSLVCAEFRRRCLKSGL